MITGRSVRQDHIQNQRIHDASIPRDPAVPSERKWDWGIIYYSLEGDNRTFSDSGHGSIGMVDYSPPLTIMSHH